MAPPLLDEWVRSWGPRGTAQAPGSDVAGLSEFLPLRVLEAVTGHPPLCGGPPPCDQAVTLPCRSSRPTLSLSPFWHFLSVAQLQVHHSPGSKPSTGPHTFQSKCGPLGLAFSSLTPLFSLRPLPPLPSDPRIPPLSPQPCYFIPSAHESPAEIFPSGFPLGALQLDWEPCEGWGLTLPAPGTRMGSLLTEARCRPRWQRGGGGCPQTPTPPHPSFPLSLSPSNQAHCVLLQKTRSISRSTGGRPSGT